MAPEPPPFSLSTYWEERFTNTPQSFDWLTSASTLSEALVPILPLLPSAEPKILHIGCGTSLLSFHLRVLAARPEHVLNVDFSQRAIELGRKKEREFFVGQDGDPHLVAASRGNVIQREQAEKEQIAELERDEGDEGFDCMRWSVVDLLSLGSVSTACHGEKFDAVIDKSTCDAIACGENVEFEVPGVILRVHPVLVLAVHLARVTNPGARWLVLSYSAERFAFCEPDAEPLPEGYPNAASLWRLERKDAIEAVEQIASNGVHRPKVYHWLYVLVRTDNV